MKVHTISSPEHLPENGTAFELTHLLWGTKSIPRTTGKIGYIENDGFYISMRCEESNPLCTYTENGSPVYRDSAMEAFFLFGSDDGPYINIEFNANGALLAMHGRSRSGRVLFTPRQCQMVSLRANIYPTFWEASFRLPITLLKDVYGTDFFLQEQTFSANFYKISETPALEHYTSFAPIISGSPDFHLPEYFEKFSF